MKEASLQGSESCYLIRPLVLGGPSWDLGSGLRELHTVSLQVCMNGQPLGPVEHTSTADHTSPTRLSTQRSSSDPVSSALCSAASTWPRCTGILRTGFRPWKLCSMYLFLSGPLCIRKASSVRERDRYFFKNFHEYAQGLNASKAKLGLWLNSLEHFYTWKNKEQSPWFHFWDKKKDDFLLFLQLRSYKPMSFMDWYVCNEL